MSDGWIDWREKWKFHFPYSKGNEIETHKGRSSNNCNLMFQQGSK